MRVDATYIPEERTLVVRLEGREFDPTADIGQVDFLPGCTFVNDPDRPGLPTLISTPSPFYGRTPEWSDRLEDVLGPVLPLARDAWEKSGEYSRTYELFESDLVEQFALWHWIHSQIRIAAGESPLEPLGTKPASKALREFLRRLLKGGGFALPQPESQLAKGSEVGSLRLPELRIYIVDTEVARAIGIEPQIRVETIEGISRIAWSIVDPDRATGVVVDVLGDQIDLGGLPTGEHEIELHRPIGSSGEPAADFGTQQGWTMEIGLDDPEAPAGSDIDDG